MTTETDSEDRQRDRQSADSLSFLSPVWVSVTIYLSLFLRLVSICVMRKRKFSEYEIAFIPFQTVGECSLPRIPSSPTPPSPPPLPATPSLACLAGKMLFITFILISYKLSHKLKFVLSLFPPRSTHAAVSGPQMADYKFSMYTRNSQNIAARRPFWFYSVFLFFASFGFSFFFRQFHFCHCSVVVVVVTVVVVSAAARLRFNAHIASYRALLPTC